MLLPKGARSALKRFGKNKMFILYDYIWFVCKYFQ